MQGRSFIKISRVLVVFLLGFVDFSYSNAYEFSFVPQTGHLGQIATATATPDGEYIVTGGGILDGRIKIWRASDGTLIKSFKASLRSVTALAVDTNGWLLVSGGGVSDNSIKVWDFKSGELITSLDGHEDEVSSLVITPGGEYLVSGSLDKTIKIWRIESGELVRTLHTKSGVTTLAFYSDSNLIISGNADGSIILWRVKDGKRIMALGRNLLSSIPFIGKYFDPGHTDTVTGIVVSPDGRYLISGSLDKTIRVWQLSSGKLLRILKSQTGIVSLAVIPNTDFIISGSADGTITVWEIRDGNLIKKIIQFQNSYVPILTASQGDSIIILDGHGNLEIAKWIKERALKKSVRKSLSGSFFGMIKALAVTPDERFIITAGFNRFHAWGIDSSKIVKTLELPSVVYSVVSTPDAKHLLAGCEDGNIEMWGLPDFKLEKIMTGHTSVVKALSITPDSKFVISGSEDRTLKIWDLHRGSLVGTLGKKSFLYYIPYIGRFFDMGHTGSVDAIAYLTKEEIIISGGGPLDGTIRLWNLRDKKQVYILNQLKGGGVTSLVVSPDNRYLYVAGGGFWGTIEIWDIRNRKYLGTLVDETAGILGYISSLALSPDGNILISGNNQGVVTLWKEKEWEIIPGHELEVTSLVVANDGRFLLSGSLDGTLKIWRLNDGKLLATLLVDPEGHWAIGTPNGLWDADTTEKLVVLNRRGTLEVYTPSDPICKERRFPGLLRYIWTKGEVPNEQ